MKFEDWRTVKLKDIATINMGQSPKSEFYNDYEGVPFLQGTRTFKRLYPDIDTYTLKVTKTARKGDILFSVRAPVGDINFAPVDLCIGRGLASLSSKSNNQIFLYYLLIGNFNLYESQSTGTIFSSINKKTLEELEFTIPNNKIQRNIGEFLWSFDKKIELNNSIFYNLENLAQTLFKRWFVDFEFPNENGKPYKSSGGKMVESELGMIPEGWSTGKLKEISINLDRKRIPLSKLEREKRKAIYPYYGAATLMDYVDDYLFDGVHVLVGEDGTVIDKNGFPVLQYVWGKFWVNNHAHVLKGNDVFRDEYIYLLLKQSNVQNIVTGAVQPKINQTNLNNIKVIIPDNEILNIFYLITDSIFEKIRSISNQNKTLTELRDTLLPKLLSGEIKLPDTKEVTDDVPVS